MQKQRPSASLRSTLSPLLVSLTEAGYGLAPIWPWFLRSWIFVDMLHPLKVEGFVWVERTEDRRQRTDEIRFCLFLSSVFCPLSSVLYSSSNNQLIAKHKAGRVGRAGINVLDAAQVGLIVLQGGVAEARGEEL